MKETILFDNGFLEFVQTEECFLISGEEKIVKRNMVRRPPGVRAMIVNKDHQILFSKEYRYELSCFDYRLPGGKVFDELKSYKEALIQDKLLDNTYNAVIKEVKEEVGLEIRNPELFHISKAGAGVVWDLYYFLITDYKIIDHGQELENDEIVEGFVWKNFSEIEKMIINHEIHEERSIGVLFRYILNEQKKDW